MSKVYRIVYNIIRYCATILFFFFQPTFHPPLKVGFQIEIITRRTNYLTWF